MKSFGNHLLAVLLAAAATGSAGNLLVNGNLEAEQGTFPDLWICSPSENILYSRSGAPNHGGVLTFQGSGGCRQYNYKLVEGEKYKISGWFKTAGFKATAAGFVIHNAGWTKAEGIANFPENSDWTYREKTVTAIPSTNGYYGVALYANGAKGKLQAAGLSLEPLTEKGSRESRNPFVSSFKTLVPLDPLLSRIPAEKPVLRLGWFYGPPVDVADFECIIAIDGKPAGKFPPDRGGIITVKLPAQTLGDHRLQAKLAETNSGKVFYETEYPIAILATPKMDLSHVKVLNNLVSELFSEPVKISNSESRRFTFTNPRDGWVFIALSGPDAAKATVSLDKPVILPGADRPETMRCLSAGTHEISISADTFNGMLTVRAIPEILNYPPCADSAVAGNGKYDWPFMKKYINNACNTFVGGKLPSEARTLGFRWLTNMNLSSRDLSKTVQRIAADPGMKDPQYDGVCVDEFMFFGDAEGLGSYARSLRQTVNPENKLIYTWIVGKPSLPGIHHDFMSAAVNASHGNGRLLIELYCQPQTTEAACSAYLDGKLTDTARKFKAFMPQVLGNTEMIFGNFTQMPLISLDHNPEIDYKYFLDMQLNLIANHPEFRGLAGVGYWGSYYADEEMLRWSFRLMRHYAVEGKKEMLSAEYGYKFCPGLLRNGDFARGFESWQLTPGQEGSITAGSIAQYGSSVQKRWAAVSGAGDTFCLMKRNANSENKITQSIEGLVPGKLYSLQFITADYRDVIAHKVNPRRLGVDAVLTSAEVVKDKSFVHVDVNGFGNDKKYGRTNLHRIVFRATASCSTVTFSDAAALPGEELILNFVQVRPYFNE